MMHRYCRQRDTIGSSQQLLTAGLLVNEPIFQMQNYIITTCDLENRPPEDRKSFWSICFIPAKQDVF